jgi:hypothetical protein
MDVACLSPLPVGVVRWNSPDPLVTVVVKATFSLERDGQALLAKTPVPLGVERQSTAFELHQPSDFAPAKARCDVLMVGSARSPKAATQMRFALGVDDFRSELLAVSERPSTAIRLAGASLRDPDDPARSCRFAPVAADVPRWVTRTVGAGFDFGGFNVAPPEHRLDEIASDATLSLENLLVRSSSCRVTLPGLAPVAFFLPSRLAAHAPQPVTMRCDTLWIDTDAALCTLCWRGIVPRDDRPDATAGVVIALASQRAPLDWAQLAPRLATDVWRPALSEDDLVPATDTVEVRSGPASALEDLRATNVIDSRAGRPAPVGQAPDPPAPTPDPPAPDPRRKVGSGTVALDNMAAAKAAPDADGLQSIEALREQARRTLQSEVPPAPESESPPTRLSSPGDAPAAAPATARAGVPLGEVGLGKATLAAEGGGPALPFRSGAAAPPPAAAPDVTQRSPKLGGETLAAGDVSLAQLLPFAKAREDRAVAEAPPKPPSAEPAAGRFNRTMDVHDFPRESLPFRRGDQPAAPPAVGSDPAAAALPQALPFESRPEAAFAMPAPPDPLAQHRPSDEAAPAPVSVSEQETTKLAPAEAGMLPLEHYAAIKAELYDGKDDLATVLKRHAVSDERWRDHERAQAMAVAREASRGNVQLAAAIRRAILDAREKRAPSKHGMTVEQFAELRVAVEEADDPDALLEARGLTAAQWQRRLREWSERAKADGVVAAELRAKLAEIRRRR